MKRRMVMMIAVVILFCQNAWGLADSFVFPVLGDGKVIGSNIEDPRSYGWNTNGNPFGNNLSSCPVSGSSCTVNSTYHPAEDWNRNDGQDGNVNVYSIGNGVITRIVSNSAYGMTILVRYDLGEEVDFSPYFLLGTTPSSTYKISRYIIAQYMHINVTSSLVVGQQVVKGQLLGKIISSFSHLHFEIMVAKSTETGTTARNICGYYTSKQGITSDGYINPTLFIKNYKKTILNPPILFSGSTDVYWNSNGQLWPIRNDVIYALLGYRKGDCMSSLAADWSKLKVLPASDKSKYVIRPETIGTAGTSPMWRISYRETPGNCTVGPVDTTKLYLFSLENGQPKFRHIPDWNVYLNLGFNPNGKDIVDVPMELFNYFGKGAEINSGNVVAVVATNSSFLFDNTHLSINETEILPPVNSTSLNAPINFSGEAIAGNQIQLVWGASNGSMEVDYKIYRKKEGDSGDPVYWGHTNQTNCKDDEVLSNQTYCYQVTASYGGEESAKTNIICVSSTYVNVTTPSEGGDVGGDWSIASIGDGLVNGTAYYSENSHAYTIKGAGIGIGNDNVKCTYMYQAHSDCAGVKTHLISHTLADPDAMAGIMFMETPNINSNYVLVAATQNNGIVFQYKEYGIVTKIGSDYFDYPVYLRLSRNRNKFMAQYSFTGISSEWISIGTISLNFSANYQVGLFATPGNDSSVSTAIFENLDVNSSPQVTSGLRIK